LMEGETHRFKISFEWSGLAADERLPRGDGMATLHRSRDKV
jgi:hypothetical protein